MLNTQTLVNNFTRVIVNPIIALLFALGLLLFAWGIIEFLIGLNASGDSDKKESGKRHMLWGIIGMFIMISAWAIIKFIDSSIGSNALG
ncbi:MAG: hypothetical protein KGH79_00880 [Patescibacteria group bacterium]|nr:hypothetical protein [Patescibacteria group bacterium]